MTIFGAYWDPTNSTPGASTAYFQQRILLMTMQDLEGSTDSRDRFITNLFQAVNNTQYQGDEVIVSLDANPVVGNEAQGLIWLTSSYSHHPLGQSHESLNSALV